MSTMRSPPNTVCSTTMPVGRSVTSPIDDRAGAGRMRAHRRQHAVGVGSRHHRHELALVGQIQRIEAEDLAGALDLLAQRQRVLANADADIRSRARTRSAPWRCRRASRRAGSGSPGTPPASPPPARPAAGSRCDTSASSASWLRAIRMAAPWSPSAPLTMTTSPGRAWFAEIVTPVRHHADAGGVDEQLVGGAALDDLGVAGHDRDAGLHRRRASCWRPRGAACRRPVLPRAPCRTTGTAAARRTSPDR